MFNPVIIGALIVQSLISRGSKMAGAIVGYLITTGIAICGSSCGGRLGVAAQPT